MIQPVVRDEFISTGKYEEIGTVLEVAEGVSIPVGVQVCFESWMAKKFPVKGKPGEFYWFVPEEDVVAYEPLPK